MPHISPLELAIILVIALVVFGPKRLPELGRSLGRGIREFRGSMSGDDEESERQDRGGREEIGPGQPPSGEAQEGEAVTQDRD